MKFEIILLSVFLDCNSIFDTFQFAKDFRYTDANQSNILEISLLSLQESNQLDYLRQNIIF